MSLLWARVAVLDAGQNEVDPKVRYISHHDLADMYSGDYDVKIPHTMREMQDEWRNVDPGARADYLHTKDVEHGGPRAYVNHLKADIAANGITEPLTVRGTNVIKDGNHRAIALYEMKHPRIPVRDVR